MDARDGLTLPLCGILARCLAPDTATQFSPPQPDLSDQIPNERNLMKPSVYGIKETDIFRLITAFTAIRSPEIRAEFLRTVEAWAQDQWHEFEDR